MEILFPDESEIKLSLEGTYVSEAAVASFTSMFASPFESQSSRSRTTFGDKNIREKIHAGSMRGPCMVHARAMQAHAQSMRSPFVANGLCMDPHGSAWTLLGCRDESIFVTCDMFSKRSSSLDKLQINYSSYLTLE